MSTAPTSTVAITVAEYSARIVRALRSVGGGVVEGEVQRPKVTTGGMLVFDLTDGTAKLACKVFRNQVTALEHHPRHGDLVQARIDRPDLWQAAGKLDVIVSAIALAGEGELLRRREHLLRQLTDEGLCDPTRMRPLPRFPRGVSVIAGRGSDGLRDVVQALTDRFPPVDIVTCAAVVQGVRAPLDIIDALARLDAHPLVDVIVIARGGGSVQDLVAFDDERLCRAVFACGTPVIAAIGHTDNVPVCNHVAWASQTPSRSPELAVPSVSELRQDMHVAAAQLAPVPRRVRELADGVVAARVDVATLLRARAIAVLNAAGALRDAEHGFFATRESVLARAREALAAVPGRLPDSADVAAVAGPLDARAIAFFSARAEQVRRTANFAAPVIAALTAHIQTVRNASSELRCVAPVLDARAAAVARATAGADAVVVALDTRRDNAAEHGRRLRAGIRKELADHLYNYGRALPKHTATIRDSASRLFARERERIDDTGAHTDQTTQRRLADDRRTLEHITALLTASDPRRRGWVLPTGPTGMVVRSARALALGDKLTLSFHDGAAGAVIDDVPTKENA